jgi:hypothetical protein
MVYRNLGYFCYFLLPERKIEVIAFEMRKPMNSNFDI